jgi:hypothetical protein
VQFEQYLISLNNVYVRIVAELESLLKTENKKASNYEQLSSSFASLRRVNT